MRVPCRKIAALRRDWWQHRYTVGLALQPDINFVVVVLVLRQGVEKLTRFPKVLQHETTDKRSCLTALTLFTVYMYACVNGEHAESECIDARLTMVIHLPALNHHDMFCNLYILAQEKSIHMYQ